MIERAVKIGQDNHKALRAAFKFLERKCSFLMSLPVISEYYNKIKAYFYRYFIDIFYPRAIYKQTNKKIMKHIKNDSMIAKISVS